MNYVACFRTVIGISISALITFAPATVAEEFQEFSAEIDEEALLFEEIPSVFGASKYEQKVTDAPSRISIITGAEIRRFGYRTLSDILRSLPGFSTTNDRNYSYTGVRGFGIPGDYDTRLLQLVDGHRINDNLYGSLFSDHTFPVDLDVIERVEVIRGPSSSLYGSGAFFGVVNIITKKGRDIGGWEVSGAAGSLQTNAARVTYGDRLPNGFEFLLSGSISDSDGDKRLYYPEFDDPATHNGIAENADGEEFRRFLARASYGDLTVEGVYGIREKAIPTGSYGTVFNTAETKTWDSRSYLDVKYQTLLNDGAEVLARVHYDIYRYKGDYVYDYGEPGDPYISVNQDDAKGEWWGTELQWRKQLGIHQLVVGGDFRDSLREEQRNYDLDAVYLDSSADSSVWALFVQDEIRLRDNLILNVGLRYDEYSNFGGTANPRASLIWSPLSRSTLKLLYGEAFRAPNAYELYYNDGDESQKSSPDLEPESIRTYEVVLEQQLSNSLRGVISVYKNEIADLIALTTDPVDDLLVFVNQGDAEAKGVELELENRWQSGVQASMSYSYQDAEDPASGERLVNYAQNMIKLNLTAPLWSDRLGAALEAQYESGRRTIADNKTDDRTLLNLSLYSEAWIPGLTAALTVYNLLDTVYAEPGSEEHLQDAIEQDGRTFRLRLDYAF